MSIFFTSDTHYYHKNFCRGTTEWSDPSRCRQYSTIEEMNNELVSMLNARCGVNDVLYHLGDWSFGGRARIEEFRSRLDVGTVHLILGNHDHHQKHDADYFLSRKTFNSITPYLEVVVEKQPIVLCHYAFRVWNDQNKGAWHLYGHSHGNLPDNNTKSLDVGVDCPSLSDYTEPWSMDELAAAFAHRNGLPEDHHQFETANHKFA
jgi:calcineurin-like phosphoesterase family protein